MDQRRYAKRCRRVAPHSNWRPRPDDNPRYLAPLSWRSPVVLLLPGDGLPRLGFMAPSWRAAVRQQARLARAGRLLLAVHDADGSGPTRQGKDQAAADRRTGPRRVGPSTETKMDAVEDLSPVCRALREIRSSDRCWCAVTGQQAHEARLMGKRNIYSNTTIEARLTNRIRLTTGSSRHRSAGKTPA